MEKSRDAFRTIGEVAEWLQTPTHVLRFWETRFPQLKPLKRAGGRRYYRPSDMALLGGIKKLLHDDGLTIRGVQKILREQGVKHVAGLSVLSPGDAPMGDAAVTDAKEATSPTEVGEETPTLTPQIPAHSQVEEETPEPESVVACATEAPMAIDVAEEEDETTADVVALPLQPRLPFELPEAPKPRKTPALAATVAARLRHLRRDEIEPHAQSLAVVHHMLADLRERMAEAAGPGRT